MKNGLFTTMLSENDRGPGKTNPINQLQRQIFMKRRRCSLYGGIGRELYFLSCYQITKPLIQTWSVASWINSMPPSNKSDQSWWIGNMLYFTPTTPDHTQVWSLARNFCSLDEMSYRIHHTLLIWHHRITICSAVFQILWTVLISI